MDNASFDIDMTVQNHSSAENTVDFIFTVHSDDYQNAIIFHKAVRKNRSA